MIIGKKRTWLFWAFALILSGIFNVSPLRAAYQVGDTVADFTLQNWNGQWMSLYGQTGRIVVLHFWFYS
jgi:hypothetical protein